MEGWEYLTSPIIDENIGKQFEYINKTTPNVSFEIKTDFKIPEHYKIIDTSKLILRFY